MHFLTTSLPLMGRDEIGPGIEEMETARNFFKWS